jgi:hypothetical protein
MQHLLMHDAQNNGGKNPGRVSSEVLRAGENLNSELASEFLDVERDPNWAQN